VSAPTPAWAVWIDRGGTFTDAIAVHAATGELRTAKVPSAGDAIVAAVHAVLGPTPPPHALRLGTTVATNALLERRGAPTALAITRGFADLLTIGDQTRPALFALDIVRPPPLPLATIEVEARADAAGATLAVDAPATLAPRLAALVAAGCRSLAVVVMHGHAAPALEDAIAAVARAAGFAHVTCSHEVAATPGLLARAETAVIDAYLTPIVAAELAALAAALPMATIEVMTSSGELVTADRARGRALVLSGPAGGVIATRAIAGAAGSAGIGSTWAAPPPTSAGGSTSRRRYETSRWPGVRLRDADARRSTPSPPAAARSAASLDGRLTVGPDSAGAEPGPALLRATLGAALTITDVNLALGRLRARASRSRSTAPGRRGAGSARAAAGADTVDDPAAHAVAGPVRRSPTAHMAEAVRDGLARPRPRRARLHAGRASAAPPDMHVWAGRARAGHPHASSCRAHASLLSAWGIGHADRAWRVEVDGAAVAAHRRRPDRARAPRSTARRRGGRRRAARRRSRDPRESRCGSSASTTLSRHARAAGLRRRRGRRQLRRRAPRACSASIIAGPGARAGARDRARAPAAPRPPAACPSRPTSSAIHPRRLKNIPPETARAVVRRRVAATRRWWRCRWPPGPSDRWPRTADRPAHHDRRSTSAGARLADAAG
jgi:5-oxoprolinase (ATP-hydrolysing)